MLARASCLVLNTLGPVLAQRILLLRQHVLRRQVMRPYRKPLIVFLSKRLLRYKDSMSPIAALTQGGFRPVIGDSTVPDAKKVKRVLLCAGQVYYDLFNARRDRALEKDIAIVRIEQLYPFPTEQVAAELARYSTMSRTSSILKPHIG